MTDLGTLYGQSESVARSINNNGQVVGYVGGDIDSCGGLQYCPEPETSYSFLYSGGTMGDLFAGVSGVSGSDAYGINNSGQVVGYEDNYSIPGTSPDFPYLYTAGTVPDLGALPGATAASPNGYAYSFATGINDSGQVVGVSEGVNYAHGFLYTQGALIDLGTLPGGGASEPNAINNTGQVVGFSYVSGLNTTHAFLYGSGAMTDLGTLPGDYSSMATAINNAGQIVGAGSFSRLPLQRRHDD